MLRSRVVNSAPQSKPSNTSTTTSEVRLNASATSRQRPTTLTLCKTAAFAATLTLSTAWLVLLLLATTIFVPETYNNQKYTTVSLDSLLSSQTPTHLRSNANANTNTNTNTNKIQQNSADQPLLPFRNVFVAANFYNSEDILTTILLKLVALLQPFINQNTIKSLFLFKKMEVVTVLLKYCKLLARN
jgi:hypothetical protein